MLKDDFKRSICVNITRRCNLDCRECYVSSYINKPNLKHCLDLSLDSFITKIVKLNPEEIYLTGGEPFLHPQIYEIIDYLYNNGKKIFIATNGLLLDERTIDFIKNKRITLLISLRMEYKKIISIVNTLGNMGVDVRCYHLPEAGSAELLYEFMDKCTFVKEYKILYNSKNSPRPRDWFSQLEEIYLKIRDISKNKNVNVELGFLPKDHVSLKHENDFEGFNGYQINTEGSIYSCPLLAEKNIKNDCTIKNCPIKERNVEDEIFKSICCFKVTSLENAMKLWALRKYEYEKRK